MSSLLTQDTKKVRLKTKNWYHPVFFLAILSGIFGAGFRATDSLVVNTRIVANDDLISAAAYLVVGSWVGMVVGIIFSLLFGRKLLDSKFHGLQLHSRRMHIAAALCGVSSAWSTLAVLLGNLRVDPSVIIAFSVLGLFITSFWDVRLGQLRIRIIIVPSILALIGCMLAVYSGGKLWEAATLNVVALLLVSQLLNAFNEVVEQDGVRASDGVSFFLWRWMWLTITGTVTSFTIAAMQGKLSLLTSNIFDALQPGVTLMWVMLTMLLVYLSITLRLVAKRGDGAAVTMVFLLATCSQIIVGIPITLIGSEISSNVFGGIPGEVSVWLVRTAGVMIVMWSVFRMWKARLRGV